MSRKHAAAEERKGKGRQNKPQPALPLYVTYIVAQI